MCSSARVESDLKSPEVNARYQRKVDRNRKVDAARTLIDMASSFQTKHVNLKEQVSEISGKYKVLDFEGKDDKTKYYTGLQTVAVLWTLFSYLEPHLPVKKTMDKFQLLMMTNKVKVEFSATEF